MFFAALISAFTPLIRWTDPLIVAFFVMRVWENDAFAATEVTDTDIENARDEVLGADPKENERRWDDDD